MSRTPIRARLTIAFALAMALVLAGAGAFVYVRLDSDLTEAVDDTLEARAASVQPPSGRFGVFSRIPDPFPAAPGERDEGFAQVVGGNPGNQRITRANVGGAGAYPLTPSEVRQAREEAVIFERDVQGIDGPTRILAMRAPGPDRRFVLVVGQSLEDRDETLASLVASFAIGGPIAILIASLVGYALASAGFRPVEAMRRRARDVSFERGSEPLPLPEARDEIRRLGETLNEMLARLRASFERERSFVADASHELRSPIAVIKAELDNALRAGGLDAETRESLVSAGEECDRLAQLADDLLVLARSAEGALPVHREPVDVAGMLDEARTRFTARAAERGREIVVEAEGDLRLDADPLRLRQALGNLVDNALRHGEGTVFLRARGAGDLVEIEVCDEGAGFSDVSDRAFERFVRGDPARSRGGAGLGLAIVRAIAQAHDGSAEIVAGQGACVRLGIPAARSQGRLSDTT